MRDYLMENDRRQFLFVQQHGVIYLDSPTPSQVSDLDINLSKDLAKGFVQEAFENTFSEKISINEIFTGEWRLFSADETPLDTACWGFEFRYRPNISDYVKFSLENNIRQAWVLAKLSKLTGEPLDHVVLSRYNFEAQSMEYAFTDCLADLTSHPFWSGSASGEPCIEVTIHA